jgi:hypothetical protein
MPALNQHGISLIRMIENSRIPGEYRLRYLTGEENSGFMKNAQDRETCTGMGFLHHPPRPVVRTSTGLRDADLGTEGRISRSLVPKRSVLNPYRTPLRGVRRPEGPCVRALCPRVRPQPGADLRLPGWGRPRRLPQSP